MDRPGEAVFGSFSGWLRTLIYTALWAFVFTGGLGLIEGLWLWLQTPAPLLDGQSFGVVRRVAPLITVYGWTGFWLSILYFGPSTLILRRRLNAPARIAATATAAAFSAPMMIQVGFLLRNIFQRDWWDQYEGLFVVTGFPLLYILLIVILSRL